MSKVLVTSIDCGFLPTANYPRPVLLHGGSTALLYFTAARGSGSEEERVVAVCEGCLCSKFGYPNDEALAGHPLFSSGLDFYGIFEIRPSPWMNEVKASNRVCFPAFDMPDSRHIIVTLHDHTFECLTRKFSVRLASEYPADAIVTRIAMTKKEANQALVTTATNPPPSATPPAPLSHL